MKKIGLLFSGQGAQQVGMGKSLFEAFPEIKKLYQDADEKLGFDLSSLSFEGPESELKRTAVCQPALYLHGVALLRVLKKIFPKMEFAAAAGLSLGEYTAHAAAGSFDFETGLELVHIRGALMEESCHKKGGSMAALLGASEEQALEIARESDTDAANFNSPGQVVISGTREGIAKAIEIAPSKGIKRAIELKVAGAYHSRLMKEAQEALFPYLEKARVFSPPRIPVFANVHAQEVRSEEEIKESLSKQVTGSVRWEGCIRNMISSGITHFLELGPGGVLAGFCKRIDSSVPCFSASNEEEIKKYGEVLSEE